MHLCFLKKGTCIFFAIWHFVFLKKASTHSFFFLCLFQQFLVFGFVPEPLQISVLIVFGLIWTIILSVVAGSVSSSAAAASSTTSSATMVNQVASVQDSRKRLVDINVVTEYDDNSDLELEVVMAMPSSEQQQQQSLLQEEDEFDVYCVTGMEPNCHIDPDNLFRPPVIHHHNNNNNNKEELQQQTAATAATATNSPVVAVAASVVVVED
jgi:hypothetical protein